jgi:alpha-ketoglutarate-dependent taurine dioxygenase
MAGLQTVADTALTTGHDPLDPGAPLPLSPALARRLQQLQAGLAHGRGFVLLRGLPFDRWSVEQARLVTWAIANAIGIPVSQTARGARLVDVMDTSRRESTPRQFSTSQELRLHTDPASDLIGLACVRPAASGGDSVLASAVSVHDAMVRQRPDLAAELYRGFHWHRFGEGRSTDGPFSEAPVPVFSMHQDQLSCRYVRTPIVAGQKDAGQPLSERQIEALDLFDKLACSPELRVTFRLDCGDIVLVNNLTVLHARTQFIDHAEPAPPRHLFRLWLGGFEGFRQVSPVLNYFNGGQWGIPVTGGKAHYDMQSLHADPATGGVARLGVGRAPA